MNKSGFVPLIIVVAYCVLLLEASPLSKERTIEGTVAKTEGDFTGIRHRRVTCDLLSIQVAGFSAGHAACAAHCLSLRRGFRGGSCISGVCHCRK